MKKYPKVSIIIPLYVIVPRFFEDLKKFRELNYPDYEILIVSDERVEIDELNTKLILTGEKKTGPAEKRDIAINAARGQICAFIDDDAYPDKNWLKNAVKNFKDKKIAAVGGPGVTPKEDGFWQQLTGLVYGSFFCGGHAQHRFVPKEKKYVKDYPAYNLLVRKKVLKEVGGYGTHFYGGEDTFLCLKIIKKGYKIIYDPKVAVYHHRRALFVPYLKQIANIGKHRGYFAKKYPETSRSFSYFLPSILAIGFFFLLFLSLVNSILRSVFLISIFGFWILGLLSVIKNANFLRASIASIGIIATHVVYGLSFIKGLTTTNLKR